MHRLVAMRRALCRPATLATIKSQQQQLLPMQVQQQALLSTGRRVGRGRTTGKGMVKNPPSLVGTGAEADAWQPVKDKSSGLVYYWNTRTDETTALGAPKPTGGSALAEPQQSNGGSFMGMVAQGMAFGTGAHLAGHAVRSIFGGGGGGGGDGGMGGTGSGGDSDGDNDDGSWDA